VARIADEGSFSRAKVEFEFWEDTNVLDLGGPPSAKDYIEVGIDGQRGSIGAERRGGRSGASEVVASAKRDR
jgi:hypothetical protein